MKTDVANSIKPKEYDEEVLHRMGEAMARANDIPFDKAVVSLERDATGSLLIRIGTEKKKKNDGEGEIRK